MKKIPLSGTHGQGKFAIVDDEDFARVGHVPWTLHKQGYARRSKVRELDGLLHRHILSAGPGTFVDHINGDKLDCRKSNLRLATKKENGANRPPYRNNRSGYKGVSWDSKHGMWHVQANSGKVMHFGLFENIHLAALMYNQVATQIWGEYAWVNEVDIDLLDV